MSLAAVARASFTVAPAAFLGGWVLMRPIGGGLVPGPWWTAAHAVWVVAFLFFGVMLLELRRRAAPDTRGRRVAVEVAVGVGLLSVAVNLVQVAVDLAAGFGAADGEAMRALFERFQGYPGVEVVVYGVGAQLFVGALLVLAVVMAWMRRVTASSAAVVTIGVVVLAVAMLAVGRNSPLVAAGISFLWLGTLLLGRGVEDDQPKPLTAAAGHA
ncbi:hypothetical protein ABT294_19030 [Nonomuraea sp. NPDC000554]|uniref:hypothetical protein n=1 Tax=Nonomuraea sp. NPDC000554 TaxID=3154259 RepID=UPI00332C0949